MSATFNVTKEEASSFAKVWTYKGLSFPLQDIHFQFASDFANIVLSSFIKQSLEVAKENRESKKVIEEGF